MFMLHWSYAILLPGLALILWSQRQIKRTYRTYAKAPSSLDLTGAEIAYTLLRNAGLHRIRVEMVMGELSDHYDPVAKAVRLSQLTYGSTSLASVAIAAHECGHALQDRQRYRFLRWRSSLLPAANIGSQIGPMLILLGILFSAMGTGWLIQLGIVIFTATLAFHLVTLPVEFDASRRALRLMDGLRLEPREQAAAARVLRAASWTYVATAVYSALQLLQLLVISRER
ncbi:MAG: zinc metallopeptidase [Elainellaceae cyanobacterium]